MSSKILYGFDKKNETELLEALGQKVKHVVDMFGEAKGFYKTGQAICSAHETMAPMISQAAVFVPYVSSPINYHKLRI